MSTEPKGDTRTERTGTDHLPRRGERRQQPRFRLVERRTGFDRRRRYPLTELLRDRPGLLALVLVAINALSALDFALTRIQLDAGVAREGNPVLAALFEQGPTRAWAFKTSVMLLVSIGIWSARKHRSVLLLAIGTLVLYAALVVYHLVGMKMTGLL